MRVLLHRGFLKLVTLKNEQGQADAIVPATKCVELACTLVETITSTMHTGSSGVLQAASFAAIGYLWNATITLFLYLLSHRASDTLQLKTSHRATAITLVEAAIPYFARYASVLPFADVAAKKSRRLLDKATARSVTGHADATMDHPDTNSFVVSPEDPNELLETFMMLDAPLSGIDGTNFVDSFDTGLHYDFLHQYSDISGWNPEDGESYTFFDQQES